MKPLNAPQNWQVCKATGKRQFVSAAKAHIYLRRIARKNKRNGDRTPVHVYACPSCGSHHIGHKAASAYAPVPKKKPAPRPRQNATERAIAHVARQWMLVEMKLLCAARDAA